MYPIYAGRVVSSDSQLIINAALLISDANASCLMTELVVASQPEENGNRLSIIYVQVKLSSGFVQF